MKIRHWTFRNNSGLNRVAEELSQAERAFGCDSAIIGSQHPQEWTTENIDADIHVVHSHIPDQVRGKCKRIVWIGNGTPEHVFQSAVEDGLKSSWAADHWMICQFWLQNADARITFWPRHQQIWQGLCDKGTVVDCLPMGINKEIWHPVQSKGKFNGNPSLFTAENCHYIKWPLDLFILWKSVYDVLPEACLHVNYLPRDQHRWFFPLVNRCGASFKSFISGNTLPPEELKNAFASTDYYIGLVRYGDHNRVCLEAKATGSKLISYRGNEYADYWITEGDQREMAKELTAILKGDVEPRITPEVPDIKDTVKELIKVYERIL